MNTHPPETPKERKRRQARERSIRRHKMRRNGFVAIRAWVQKETLADLKQLSGEDDVSDAIDLLLTAIRRSESNLNGIRKWRQEARVVTRDRNTKKQGLKYPMENVITHMMKEQTDA